MQPGQSLYGKLLFKNGKMSDKNRYYLIVKATDTKIGILDVSSVKGKERKLDFKSNYNIKNYKPPFWIPTFVKLDSYRELEIKDIPKDCILIELFLNEREMNYILQNYPKFN